MIRKVFYVYDTIRDMEEFSYLLQYVNRAEAYRSTMPLELTGLYFIDLPSSIRISFSDKMIIHAIIRLMMKEKGVICFYQKSHPRTTLIVNDRYEYQSRQRADPDNPK